MRKAFLCAVLVLACVSSAFGDATDQLFKAAKDSKTTPKMIENLIKFGADVNAEDWWTGWPPLMYAARDNSNPDVLNALIKAGADVNAKSPSGVTALMSAARSNSNPEVVNALINSGADVQC